MLNTSVHKNIAAQSNLNLTRHAWERMGRRGISPDVIQKVLSFGREVYDRGAIKYVVGKKEISYYACEGINLSKLNGMQVVCSQNGDILTVYRNRDFRGVRPCRRSVKHVVCSH